MATKIPSWDQTTEIPAWDDTKPIEPKPAKAEPNARDQVTFLGSENLGKLMADVFPRVARETVKGSGYGKQVGAGLLDELSLPGRGVASSGEAPKGATWKDGNPELGKIKGDGFAQNVMRDPATGAALLMAPITFGASIPALMGAGAIAGLASASAHQGERALEGQDVSIPQAAGEVALNTLMPAVGNVGGRVLQGTGKKILNTILKPKEGVQDQIERTGAKHIADLIFGRNLDSPIPFTGGVSGIQARNDAVRAEANKAFGGVMDANKSVDVDLLKAAADAEAKMGNDFATKGTHSGVLPGIETGKNHWLASLEKGAPSGKAPLAFSQGHKQEVGEAGNFLATDPHEVKGAARFANEYYNQIRDAQNALVPELKPLNKTLSDTRPIKEALADAIPRLEKNNLITPSDMWTLGPAALLGGGVGLGGGGTSGSALAFAAPLIANRLSKNPTFASQMYRLGESMIDPGTASTIRKRAIERMLSTGLYGNQ